MTVSPTSDDPYELEAAEAIGELTNALAGARSELERAEEQVRGGLRELVSGITSVADRLQTGADGVSDLAEMLAAAVRQELEESAEADAEWQEVNETLESQIAAMAEGCATLQSAIDDLDGKVEELENDLSDAMEDALAAQDEIVETVEEVKVESLESIQGVSTSLESFASAFGETLDEVCDAVEDLMTATAEDLGERFEEAMTEAVEAATESLDQLTTLIADQAVPEVVQQVAMTLVADLTGVIDDLLATFRQALGGLRERIIDSTGQTGQSRAAVDAALDQMQFLLDPIQAEIGRIRGLASSVGIGV